MNTFNTLFIIWSISFIGFFLHTNDDENQKNHYCDMSALYTESNGEYGWPPKFVESKGYDCNDSK